VSTASPVIQGTATQGQVLTTTNGSWTNLPTSYTYQWRRCNAAGSSCADIVSATTSSYTLVLADVGQTLRIVVTARNPFSAPSSPATSVQTTEVQGLPPENESLPAASGTNAQGQTLTATDGTWHSDFPVTYTYQWRRCNVAGFSCTDILGATNSTYLLAFADAYLTIRVQVTATNAYGPTTATSVQTTAITTVQSVVSGGWHTCALISDGTIRCWGYNYFGEMGNGTFTSNSGPAYGSHPR